MTINKSNLKIIAIIPARMGSSRFPGKPLAHILGIPMIEHVYKRSSLAPSLTDVFVATCDEEIMAATRAFGGKAIMTSDMHVRASDRVAEASQNIDADIVVMIQGDEPMIAPEMIEDSIKPILGNKDVSVVNLAGEITSREEFENPNTIKVVSDLEGNALYFTRKAIPSWNENETNAGLLQKQICVIPFRKETLTEYLNLTSTPLEIAESVDMLRFIEHGINVRMVKTNFQTHAVDTKEDLILVENLMRDDPLSLSYLRD